MRSRASAARVRAAETAQADVRRMWRMRQMDGGELRALLAGDPARSIVWIESAARHGLAAAQLRLGQMRLDGLGGARDEAAALGWFERAARQGSPEAMNMAGRCRELGWGAPIDLALAARWYRRSAEAEHDWGEYNYANLLFDGRGVERDMALAVVWYGRAAAQGHARAMNLLARCREEGWGAPRDRSEARAWYRRSAEAGYFRAQYNFATVLVAEGEIDAALAWFEAACAGAPPDSRRVMLDGLAGHGHPRLAALARRLGGASAARD